MFPFHVLSGPTIRALIESSREDVYDCVRETYLAHHRGESVNPDSYFLRFPERSADRIIALPSALLGPDAVAGIKWIGSFPANIEHNIPRASAVLVLNELETGHPFACLEAAQISAARTAASAVLGARLLHGSRQVGKAAVVGAGVISRTVLEFWKALGWSFDQIDVYDRNDAYARKSSAYAEELGYRCAPAASLADAVAGAEIVLLATTASEPYITDPGLLAAGQTVLNISLRDLGPEVIASSYNILDDVEHCLKAGTSPHLAVQHYGHRDFITGTIAQVILGEAGVGADRPRIFSPFGLGVLDLAVGRRLYHTAADLGLLTEIPDFFAEVERW